MKQARQETGLVTSLTIYRPPAEFSAAAAEIAKSYRGDIEKMNEVLFGTAVGAETEIEFGRYRRARAKDLHCDNYPVSVENVGALFYTARVGALPTMCILGRDERDATPDIRALIEHAKDGFSEVGANARRDLFEQKILVPAELGDVTLMRGKPDVGFTHARISAEEEKLGTWHCSSFVPRGGAYSAFFRAVAYCKRYANSPGVQG